MEKSLKNGAAELFSREFALSIGNVISETAGVPVTFTVKEAPDLSKRDSEAVHFRLRINGAEGAECFIEMYTHGVMTLGSKLLGEEPSEYREEHAKVVQQAITTAVARLKASRDMALTVERVTNLMFGGMLVVPLAGAGPGYELPALLYFNSCFQEELSPNTLNAPGRFHAGAQLDVLNLDLVMDVELNVSLRFGQREMELRDVLELESGSVIELNRRVDEPVELLLDGRVIATGEAVIVDGNYGLRVTTVSQLVTPPS
jgi:flagellar motor switch protein FliN/FliY